MTNSNSKFDEKLAISGTMFINSKHLEYLKKVLADAYQSEGRTQDRFVEQLGTFTYHGKQYLAVVANPAEIRVSRRMKYRLGNAHWAEIIMPQYIKGKTSEWVRENFSHTYGVWGWN
jgi:hypothetical protein